MSWLIILLGAVAAALGLFLSKPERPKIAWATLVIIVASGIWQAASERSEEQHKRLMERQGLERLLFANNGFMDFLAKMILAGSGEWLPKTEDEFLSKDSADLICHQLNMDSKAPVEPTEPWWSYVTRRTTQYKEQLGAIRRDYSAYLDTDVISAMDQVERSSLLAIWMQMSDLEALQEQKGLNRPPLLCWGLEPVALDSFEKLKALRRHAGERATRLGVRDIHDWNVFPVAHYPELQGRARFSDEELREWQNRYPSVGPIEFGSGDSNLRPRQKAMAGQPAK